MLRRALMHPVAATLTGALCALATCALAAAQSCLRPSPPPGGHTLTGEPVVPVTYSDGYTTFGAMTFPEGQPPACGWPLVVYVHPLGQSRGHNVEFQLAIAREGYAVWSYDVRGQGQGALVNPTHPNLGTSLWGPAERLDLAEQIAFVAAEPQWQGLVDASRLAVVGESQGGAHAWQAAAFGGTVVQVPGRPPMTLAQPLCVVAFDLVADPIDDWLRGGTLFSSWLVEALDYQGLPFDPAFIAMCRSAFVQQDPAALEAALLAEGRAVGPALAASNVPVLYSHAYFDTVDGPLHGIERIEAMSSPRRVLLSTVGHGTPYNVAEHACREVTAIRWLHRFCWSEQNEVEAEAPFVLAEMPLDAALRDDPAHLWSRTHAVDVVPAPAPERLFLHGDFTLREVPPTTPQPDAIIEQTIDPTATLFQPQTYLDDASVRAMANVLAACPLREVVHTWSLTDERRIDKSPIVHLRLVPDQAAWQLAIALTAQPPGGDEVMLTSRGIGSRTSAPGVAWVGDVRLPPIAAVLPAGTVLRLKLRNLWLRDSPMPGGLEVAPLFADFRVAVQYGGDPAASWLELPLAPVRPRVVVDGTTFDLGAPGIVAGEVRGGLSRAGWPYFAVVGLAGQLPGTPYLGDVVPIDPDWLAIASAGSLGAPVFQGFLGFLGTDGDAPFALDLSGLPALPQALNGWSFTFTAFVWDGPWAGSGAAANPVDVLLR